MARVARLGIVVVLMFVFVVSAGAAAGAATAADDVPLFKLAGDAGLPAYLKSTATTIADPTGILAAGELRTVKADFVNHDFTFDVVYHFEPNQQAIFVIGIGENGREGNNIINSVCSRVHGPGHKGNATVTISGQPEVGLGSTAAAPGPHMMRIEKRGKTLTFAVCAEFDGKRFEPAFSHTLPDLAAAAPFLTKRNSALFVGSGSGGVIEAVRLVVDGETAPAAAPTKSAGPTTAPAAAPRDDVPLFSLAGAAGLPPYLKTNGLALANEKGLAADEVRSIDTALVDKDFTFDVVFRFANEGERSLFYVGIGALRREGNWVHDSVYSRVHAPGHGGICTVTLSGQPELELGKLTKSVGPHLFRMQKRGSSLTMAISPDFSGTFDPVAVKTIPDIKAAAPFLTKRNSGLFIAGANCIESVRLWIDGKPADTGKVPAAAATTTASAAGPDGAENLIRINKSLPAFFQKETDVAFDTNGALAMEDKNLRTRATDFASKNFTFDVVYRNHSNGYHALVVGIGENRWEGNGLRDSIGVRLHGANDGVANLSIPGVPDSELGKVGRDPGPHMLRLRKVGNTLTLALTPNFDGKFDPVVSKTIPDFKAAAPFLTAKNAALFLHGHGTVEQVRLMVEGEAAESQDLVLSLTPVVVAGKALRQKVVKGEDAARLKGKRFALESGPKGLTISPAGDLSWTPTPEQVGRHEVKVRVETAARDGAAKDATLATGTIEVVSATDAAAVNGDLAKVSTLYRLPLAGDGAAYELVNGLDNGSMLLLEGEQLRRLAPDGITVKETVKLPKAYEHIRERPDYFVALAGGTEKCLDLIDKKTLKVTRSMQMEYRNRFDLALNPVRRECYVTVEKAAGAGLRSDILIVNEATGDVREPEDFIGRWVRVSNNGNVLFAGYKEIYEKGSRLLINPDRIHIVPEYGNIDLIIVYDISGPEPRILRVKDDVGGNGYGIDLSADEQRIAYLSGGGCPLYSYNISAWDPYDFTKRPVTYPTKSNGGGPDRVAFHPVLPIVASTSGTLGVLAFDRENGKLQQDRLDLRATPVPDGSHTVAVFFSPDGRNLIAQCVDDSSKEQFLLRVKLKLSPKEEADLKVRAKPAAPPPPAKRKTTGKDA